MRNLQRCLTLTALATYLLVGGLSGLCTVWSSLDIEHHHHHAQAHAAADDHHASVCSDTDDSHGEVPTLPCRESSEQDGGELTVVTPDPLKPITTPLVGLVPAAVFTPLQIVTTRLIALSAVSGEDMRGSPATQTARLCRFLV
jgi:hypothetical protein